MSRGVQELGRQAFAAKWQARSRTRTLQGQTGIDTARFWVSIEECPSPLTYRLFTPASWPRCGARSRWARLGRRGARLLTKSGRSFEASQACGRTATTSSSITTRHSRAPQYSATSVLRSHAHLKLLARCTQPKRQPERLPLRSTGDRTTA